MTTECIIKAKQTCVLLIGDLQDIHRLGNQEDQMLAILALDLMEQARKINDYLTRIAAGEGFETMSDLNLGHIIKPDEQVDIDAIHVAVAPVIADQPLHPSDHVGLVDGRARRTAKQFIGIVDPFLTDRVMPGERFWLFLYPKTITNLRHHWTHPAFEAVKPVDTQFQASERWLRAFADDSDIGYRTLMDGAAEWVRSQDYLCLGDLLEGKNVPDEFWTHYEAVTGVKGSGSFFTCSC